MNRTTPLRRALVIGAVLLLALGALGCAREHGIELDDMEFFTNEDPSHSGAYNRSLDNRFVQHPTRYVHAALHVEAKRQGQQLVLTCTLLNPGGSRMETVEKPLAFDGRQPATRNWFTNVIVSFGPLDSRSALGQYRIECAAEQAEAAGSFLLDQMTPAELFQEARPSIVLIRTLGVGEKPFAIREECQRAPIGHGTGFVIDADGYILTNHHVIDPCPEDWPRPRLQVTFADGRTAEPTLVGQDPLSDLAVLKVERTNLPTLPFLSMLDVTGDVVGAEVLAIGFAAGIEGEPTFTRGMISGLDRSLDKLANLVQTDAAINGGNSGGPLLNQHGEVVGINTLVMGRHAGMQGLNFAVSGRWADLVADRLIKTGQVRRGYFGLVNAVSITETDALVQELEGQPLIAGLLIGEVDPASPAAKAGLRRCDVIDKFIGGPGLRAYRIASVGEYNNALLVLGPGQTITVQYRRYPEEKCAAAPSSELFGRYFFEKAQKDQGEALTATVTLE